MPITIISAVLIMVLGLSSAFADGFVVRKQVSRQYKNPTTEFQGKLYCSITQSVQAAYAGDVVKIRTGIGKFVKKDQPLVRIKLDEATIVSLRKMVQHNRYRQMELDALEMERKLDTLADRKDEIRALIKEDLANPKALGDLDKEIDLLKKKIETFRETTALTKKSEADDLMVTEDKLGGVKLTKDRVPTRYDIKSPISGHVLWMSPDLRVPNKVNGHLLTIGVMDPMVIRGQIYESEAARLSIGDKAKVTLSSMPGKQFTATLVKINWTPTSLAISRPSYYEVELEVPNPDYKLKQGYKVRVEFASKAKKK